MRKVIPLLFLGMYFLLSLVVVLASSDTVISEPPLFSLIKTDTSANMNVTVQEDSLRFTPGKGINDAMFGFQPGSKYYYENLFQVKNITDDEISLWYTLEDDMVELYEDSVFRLEAEDFPEEKWYRCSEGEEEYLPDHVITLNEGEDTGGINFHFSVPHNYELGKYQGYISIHAIGEIDDEEEPEDPEEIIEPEDPEVPATGEMPPYVFYAAGLLLALVGLALKNFGTQ